MSDLPPFDQPYQPISQDLGRALQEFDAKAKAAPESKKEGAFFLVVPFAEKDEAKAMGAKWDAAARKWYVPVGKDKELFERWWPAAK